MLSNAKGGLSLERLQTLCEIRKAQGIAKAAGRDPSAMSQFSRQLKDLETHFGVILFNRQTKSFTDAGKRLLAASEPFLASLKKLSADFADANQSISIGAGQAVLDWVLFPRFAELASSFPRTVWSIRDLNSRNIKARLLECDLDFGILRKEQCEGEDLLDCHNLGDMRVALFVPKRLRNEEVLPVASMLDSDQFTAAFEELADKFTPRLVIKFKCQSFPEIQTVVKTGLYAGPLPLLVARDMPSAEFDIIKHPALQALTRHYVLASQRKNTAMRELADVQRKLAAICRMQ